MNTLLSINIVILTVNFVNCYRTNNIHAQGVFCRDPIGLEGVCRNIKQCPIVLRDFVQLVSKGDESYIQYLRQSNEICQRPNTPIICCPVKQTRTTKRQQNRKRVNKNIMGRLLTPEDGCGLGKPIRRPRTLNPAFKTKPGVYPWVTLIGYTNSTGKSDWECGGTLITSRHVLTSAHCVNDALSFVRLGVFEISSNNDQRVQDIKVIRSEQHPDYNEQTKMNDIAILYLERDVKFTDRIRPICLPLNEPIRSQRFVDYTPFIAAWLRAPESKNIPSQKVMRDWQLIVLDNAECRKSFEKQGKLISNNQFDDSVMCADNTNAGNIECQIDSGLMQPIFNEKSRTFSFYQTGIISNGIGCQSTNTPPVYTRVQHFVDWIEENVKQ